MPTKKAKKTASPGAKDLSKMRAKAETEPKFPYTTKPSSLRRLLQDIPKKPKPVKVDQTLMKSWGYSDTNDMTVLRVLKAVGLLTNGNEPTDVYTAYMNIQTGSTVLAEPIRKLYEPLFISSHQPDKESAEFLKNQFNIHSGGSQNVLDLQVQTFKALCENTVFGTAPAVVAGQGAGAIQASTLSPGYGMTGAQPGVHINLHIHLPENKSRRDYEQIIEDIGRYIFGRSDGGGGNG
jgi:hypothetical protein